MTIKTKTMIEKKVTSVPDIANKGFEKKFANCEKKSLIVKHPPRLLAQLFDKNLFAYEQTTYTAFQYSRQRILSCFELAI